MEFSGHTNATYGYNIEEAIDLFSALGFRGMEIGCNEISGITIRTPTSRRCEIAVYAKNKGLVISNLACYAGQEAGLTSLDPFVRHRTLHQMKEHIRLAKDLNCKQVRIFPGRDTGEEIADDEPGFRYAAEAYRNLSEFAYGFDVILLVENHPMTITISAKQTIAFVKAVDCENVRILYDPSNLIVYVEDKDVEGSFRIQKDFITHVHMKDQLLLKNGRYEDTVVGRGVVPWLKILKLLKDTEYGGFISMEYQRGKQSTEHLPDPDIGMREGLVFLEKAKSRPGLS